MLEASMGTDSEISRRNLIVQTAGAIGATGAIAGTDRGIAAVCERPLSWDEHACSNVKTAPSYVACAVRIWPVPTTVMPVAANWSSARRSSEAEGLTDLDFLELMSLMVPLPMPASKRHDRFAIHIQNFPSS
jgi:hypothetical protein